jgi:FkbM family methyltransferase
MTIKGAIRELIGPVRFAKLRSYRDKVRASAPVNLKVGCFNLIFPGDHILPSIQSVQPDRNLALGIAAREIFQKYPGKSFVDIGANVGDTGAIVASYSDCPMVLVEPSDTFFGYLEKNSAQFANQVELVRSFISDGLSTSGNLVHGSGTAYLDASAATTIPTRPISSLSRRAGLIKVDTDGFDFKIISAGLDYLKFAQPALYFENEIFSAEALIAANNLFIGLSEAGYHHFMVFDAMGVHMTSTSDIQVVHDLNRYLYRVMTGPIDRMLYSYDVLCLADKDTDVAERIAQHYRTV